MEFSRESVLSWLAGLPEGQWAELLSAACAQRPPHPQDGAKYALAHVWRLDREEPWEVELVGRADREQYPGGFMPNGHAVIRAATCGRCGQRVGSWPRQTLSLQTPSMNGPEGAPDRAMRRTAGACRLSRRTRLTRRPPSLSFIVRRSEDARVVKRTALMGILAVALCAGCGDDSAPTNPPPKPSLSPNAPQDQPVSAKGEDQVEEYRAAIAPYVEQGRKTYPEAKKRYLAGLPAGRSFFAVTNLRDVTGASEQVFVAVAEIEGDRITGRIASDIVEVEGFNYGDAYSFPESELVDWLITHPDGSEEGNVVGKFLDEWQKSRPSK